MVVLVRPTPQFNTSVLFQLRSAEAASLVRRHVAVAEDLPDTAAFPTSPATVWRPGLRKRSDDWISQGWNVECKVQTDWYICRVWDPQGGTWSTQGPGAPIHRTTTVTTLTSDTPVTITSYETEATETAPSTTSASPSRTSSSARPTSTSSGTAGNDTIPGVFVGLWVS